MNMIAVSISIAEIGKIFSSPSTKIVKVNEKTLPRKEDEQVAVLKTLCDRSSHWMLQF